MDPGCLRALRQLTKSGRGRARRHRVIELASEWDGRITLKTLQFKRICPTQACTKPTCVFRRSRTARFRDQLQLGDEANSIIADGGDLGTCRPQVNSVGDLPTSSVSAVQLVPETMCSARTHPVSLRRSAAKPRGPAIRAFVSLYSGNNGLELGRPLANFATLRHPAPGKAFHYLRGRRRCSLTLFLLVSRA
jgi:hypothetical protein